MSEDAKFSALFIEHLKQWGALKAIAGSPIEVALGKALLGYFMFGVRAPTRLLKEPVKPWPAGFSLVPQAYLLDMYRVDFLVGLNLPVLGRAVDVVIECDGHNFHERTPEQALKDRSRDRDLALGGFRVLRFTGREIVRDVDSCVAEVEGHFAQLLGVDQL